MTSNTISGSFSGITSNVNDGLTLVNNRAYAVTDGGALHVLDAFNFNQFGVASRTSLASPIRAPPPSRSRCGSWIDFSSRTTPISATMAATSTS